MAKLNAYAPQKAKDFVKLEKILLRDAPTKAAKPHWRDVLAKMSSWAKPKQG
ncbi:MULTISPECIES: hypothetical protein [unclassified Ensifer]|uniref:hypothetical protein n=1 Tax=unclassified Ensifer TaxID=2633371 RepID=UPI00300FA2BC